VTDNGLPAALFMALTFSLIRAETKRERDSLQVLQNVNRSLLSMNASGLFVTLSYCILDYRTGSFRYYRAGHPKPIILDSDGEVLDLNMNEGQPLGIFTNIKIDVQECILPPGGAVLLYSDGLSEAMNAQGLEFGSDRVRREFSIQRQEHASEICRYLRLAVEEHCEGQPNQDDFTAVVIKRENGGKAHP
jgi:sigma-B regulation protein RsbU (phosphoserine phosphatase)